VGQFEQAAALQDARPYTEPPFWHCPVRQSLTAALMQAGRLIEGADPVRAEARPGQRADLLWPRNSGPRAAPSAAQQAGADLAPAWAGDRAPLQITLL
jgi:hypothetical protein